MISECIECGGYPIEANYKCASCNARKRKEERQAQKDSLKKPYRIQKFSKKMVGELKTYRELRKEHLAKHPFCFANLQGCTKKAVDVHHLGGRGSNLNKEETFMSVCRNCHSILHQKLSAVERREKGLTI